MHHGLAGMNRDRQTCRFSAVGLGAQWYCGNQENYWHISFRDEKCRKCRFRCRPATFIGELLFAIRSSGRNTDNLNGNLQPVKAFFKGPHHCFHLFVRADKIIVVCVHTHLCLL